VITLVLLITAACTIESDYITKLQEKIESDLTSPSSATYTITYDGNGNDDGAPPVDLNEYDTGETVTVLGAGTMSKIGNIFIGWSIKANGLGAYYHQYDPLTITTDDIALYAQWSSVAYELTVQAGINGTVIVPASSPLDVGHGAPTTITAVPDSGYSFTSWTVTSGTGSIADSSASSTTVTLENGDTVITANFSLSTYKLTVQAQTGGLITQPVTSPVTVDHGATTSISASVNTAYTFNSWAVTSGTASITDDSSSTTTITLNDGDATVTASFNIKTYQLTVGSGTGGSITQPNSSPTTVAHGADTAISAVADNGLYIFDIWDITSGTAVIADASSKSTTVQLESGPATLEAVWQERFSGGATIYYSQYASPADVYVIDVDGDGHNDVLSALFGGNDIVWHENDGAENFTPHTIDSNAGGASSVYALDLDEDGDIDVLSASAIDDEINWYENNGSESFNDHTITTSVDNAISVYSVDVNSDGNIDVLSASGEDDTIAWYENNGSESFTSHVISTTADGAISVHAIDVDSDGDMDILSASAIDDTITWYENSGAEVFTTHTISTSADGANQVYAIDVDSDDDIDVLSASIIDNKVAWYENDGSENFSPHEIIVPGSGPRSVFAADLDNDGDIDILSAFFYSDTVVWFENNGDEVFTIHTITTALEEPLRVFAADIDGDGDNDVFAVSMYDDTVAWYENMTIE
jgi:hypothetical protein